MIIDFFKNKTIAILGFGKEGKSTYNYIRKYSNMPLDILDKNNIDINDTNVNLITGEDYLSNLDKYDIIMKSPGISLNHLDISEFQDKIYSQLEILLMFYKDNVIGITGTKGKSTTTSLIYEVLKHQLDNVYLVGNIGIPIFDMIDKFNDNSIIVAEMSSHQLEYIKHSPHIGIILNLYQDHLDHALSVKHYHECKMHMFDYQESNDISIYCADNETLKTIVEKKKLPTKLYPISLSDMHNHEFIYEDNVLYVDDDKRNLIGDHNLENIMVVTLVAYLYNLDLKQAKEVIDNFKGLEHRLELVGTYNDITYYNDTIATIPEATISGIKALGNVNTLIFGGMDRGIDYHEFIKFLRNSDIKNLICMPTTGYNIGKVLNSSNKNIIYASTLEEAVQKAKEVTEKNSICLLSPAASSYEYFKNFEEKGERYKSLVKGD